MRSFNPFANESYHSHDDLHLINSHAELGLKAGSSVAQQHLDTLVCEVPSLVTKDLALERLVQIAESSDSFLRMLASWEDAPSQRLSDLFVSQSGDTVDVDTELLKAIHKSAGADRM